jgi:hypothetical protein
MPSHNCTRGHPAFEEAEYPRTRNAADLNVAVKVTPPPAFEFIAAPGGDVTRGLKIARRHSELHACPDL